METDELSLSQAPTMTSQDTRIPRPTDTRLSPAVSAGLFDRVAMRRSQSQHSQTPGELILTPEMLR